MEIFLKRQEAKRQLAERRAGLGKPKVLPAYEFLYWTHMPETGVQIRFKVAKGGRGKGASWAIADRLLEKATSQPSIILCAREVQNSIADSVHRLLKNRIKALGYGDMFHVTANSIKSLISDSEFIFRGVTDLSVDDVKSMEGITDVWLAEAHKCGARTWLVLEPTIRTDGSTLYVDYNPDAEDAPTNVKFTTDVPDNALVRHLTFEDNPYFPDVLEKLRQQSLERIAKARNDEDRLDAQLEYDHVWLGATRKMGAASIFGSRCYFEEFETPETARFFHGLDFGYANDPNALVRCFESPDQTELFIDAEAFGHGIELDELPTLLDSVPSARKWPIKADCSRPETISHVRRRGFNIEAAAKWQGSVEDGIAFLRSYKRIVIHATKCPNMVREAKKYSWKLDKLTQEILPIPVDAENHGWDALRYALVSRIQRKTSFFTG